MGNGDGFFGGSITFNSDVGAVTPSIDVGDLNGDGRLDFVSGGTNGRVTVRLQNADGSFSAAVSYVAHAGTVDVVKLGDLNGDGFDDLLSGGDGNIVVRLSTGTGTFDSAVTYNEFSDAVLDIALDDLNGDGVLDMFYGGFTTSQGEVGFRMGVSVDGLAPILPFDLSSISGARHALSAISKKIELLAAQRGEIGAFQSRIGVALNTLQVSADHSIAAAERIRSADVAEESARLMRLQILQQASTAILGQSNQQPEIALLLLQGNN